MAEHFSHETGKVTMRYSSRCEKFTLAKSQQHTEEHQKISGAGSVSEEKYFGM